MSSKTALCCLYPKQPSIILDQWFHGQTLVGKILELHFSLFGESLKGTLKLEKELIAVKRQVMYGYYQDIRIFFSTFWYY